MPGPSDPGETLFACFPSPQRQEYNLRIRSKPNRFFTESCAMLALLARAWLGWPGVALGSGGVVPFVEVDLARAEFGQATLPGIHGEQYI